MNKAVSPRVEVLESAAAVAARTAELLGDALEKGPTSVMLAGGTTPRASYEALAARPLSRAAWANAMWFFGDERAVAPEHDDSNYAMAKKALFDRAPIDPASVHRMRGEADDLEAAAREYEALLPSAIDVVLLGMGEDGHTASLFPNAASLGERERRVIPVVGPKPPPRRLTITPRVIEEARLVVLLATGASKAPALARVLAAPPGWSSTDGIERLQSTPAALARGGLILCDRALASALPAGSIERFSASGP
ncbi:MAG: 6-phosphogluconolactonase [Polyangiaceae bacterium]